MLKKIINFILPRINYKINKIRSLYLKCRLQYCGKNIKVWGPYKIKNPENIEVGNNLSINDYVYINGLGGIKIGNDVSLSAACMLISTKLDKKSKPFNLRHINESISIGNNVQIGAGAIILPGVRIGDNTIIGAGAVVTKNIKENSVATGIPAKEIDTAI